MDNGVEDLRDRIKQLEADLAVMREENEKLRASEKIGDEMLEAQIVKYEGCPHSMHNCACSHDHISHVCGVHAPQLAKVTAELALRTQERDRYKALVESADDEGGALVWSSDHRKIVQKLTEERDALAKAARESLRFTDCEGECDSSRDGVEMCGHRRLKTALDALTERSKP